MNQPIEEKWKGSWQWRKGSWQWRSDRMGLDKDQHDEIFDFIENLLEQERQRMSEEIYQARKSNTTDSAGDVWEKVLSIINK